MNVQVALWTGSPPSSLFKDGGQSSHDAPQLSSNLTLLELDRRHLPVILPGIETDLLLKLNALFNFK